MSGGIAHAAEAPGSDPTGVFRPRQTFLQRRDFRAFRCVLEGLRRNCPAAFPIVVRTSRLPNGIQGYCKRRRNRFVVHFSSSLTQSAAIDTLLHEWAHALGWNLLLDRLGDDMQAGRITPQDFEELSHGPEFGTAFATVWRAFAMKIVPSVGAG